MLPPSRNSSSMIDLPLSPCASRGSSSGLGRLPTRQGEGSTSVQSSPSGSPEEHATRTKGRQRFRSCSSPARSCSGMRPSSAFSWISRFSQRTSPPFLEADSWIDLRKDFLSAGTASCTPPSGSISSTRLRSVSARARRTPSVILKVHGVGFCACFGGPSLLLRSLSSTICAKASRPSVSASTILPVRPMPLTFSSTWSSLPSKRRRDICGLLMPCSALTTQA
mmetsp:Transcript_34189/g.106139  ORF Transcript_34189/g.106139 Transcript_34189/m.106139 type:complete len:223 (-) Transcript_34189:587-1255(-)